MAQAHIDTDKIRDWSSFHRVCKEAFGFPDFYGMNLNAWIDCLSDLDEDYGMSRFPHLPPGELLHVTLSDAPDFRRRLPEVFDALIDSVSFVNFRYRSAGREPKLALVFLQPGKSDEKP
jgi:hypothetical protein